jgi:hypothetical protein
VREVDMGYNAIVAWLTQQDINQMNDEQKTIKIKRIREDNEEPYDKKQSDNSKDRNKDNIDPNGFCCDPNCYAIIAAIMITVRETAWRRSVINVILYDRNINQTFVQTRRRRSAHNCSQRIENLNMNNEKVRVYLNLPSSRK